MSPSSKKECPRRVVTREECVCACASTCACYHRSNTLHSVHNEHTACVFRSCALVPAGHPAVQYSSTPRFFVDSAPNPCLSALFRALPYSTAVYTCVLISITTNQLKGEDKVPICFFRIPAKELLEQGMDAIAPRWLLLGEDKVR